MEKNIKKLADEIENLSCNGIRCHLCPYRKGGDRCFLGIIKVDSKNLLEEFNKKHCPACGHELE